ncbi:beta-channel forming cytolysin [Bacillus cereus]|uniref:beta-channel forming cytolysin n=1 Tax=Bacillus cereus TaxID=1396 RepID=UPI000BF5DD2B|nr:beta-channel forming cytolysin [Bacillus cereus]PEQ51143.1 beta-channel forming cytolysin [Bacillus cereus]
MIKQKNNKKLLQTLALSTMVISGVLVCGNSSTYASSAATIEDIGSNASITHSLNTNFYSNQDIKSSLKASFINDPNTDKKYVILSMDGSNIDSGFNRSDGSHHARIYWTSAFNTSLEITSKDSAKFYKVAPKNEIETATVSSTVSYNIGGGLSIVSGDVAVLMGNGAWSDTVTYEQPNYKTFLTNNTDKKVEWKVEFNKFNNRGYGFYTRDSNHILYGNELFMNSRTDPHIEAENNFISNNEFPGIIRFSFQPNMIAVIIANKNENLTNLTVKHSRNHDEYRLRYQHLVGWVGTNTKDLITSGGGPFNYKIDWQNNRIIYQD